MINKTLIIAEAGVNHNGDISLAKQLIDAAVYAGADIVKFQTFKTEKLVTKNAIKASYQKKNTDDSSQFDMLKKLELDVETHLELIDYCNLKKIKFGSTAFDLESIDLLTELVGDFWKIPSGEITNLPYIKKIGALNKNVIVSTGMSNLIEVGQCIDVLIDAGTDRENITVLHCNTEYPTPMKDVNLKAMLTLKEAFKVDIGYSDHTLGIEIPIAAVAMGAKVIEKHFTLDKTLDGPDHKASLEPKELKQMIDAIRNIEVALGTGIKEPSQSEIKNKSIARKSVVAKTDIKAGDILTMDNLAIKRPGEGISPMNIEMLIGSRAIKDFKQDDYIELS